MNQQRTRHTPGGLVGRRRRRPGLALAVAIVAAALAIGPLAAAPALATGGPAATQAALTGVSAVSASDVWAVGYQGADPYTPYAEHFDGTSWKVSQIPGFQQGLTGQLEAVGAVSADDVWAVGVSSDQHAKGSLVEHYDGKTWTQVAAPVVHRAAAMTFTSASVDSSGDVWIAGFSRTDTRRGSLFQTLVERWDGTSLQIVPTPNPALKRHEINLNSIDAVAPDDVWAGGFYSTHESSYNPLVLHYDGTSWTILHPALPDGSNFGLINAFAPAGPTDVWALGLWSTGSGFEPLADHWDGSSWQVAQAPEPPGGFNGFVGGASVSSSDAWASGAATTVPLMAHWNGTAWKQATLPAGLASGYVAGMSAVSATDVWAVGFDGQSTLSPLILHWNGSKWSQSG